MTRVAKCGRGRSAVETSQIIIRSEEPYEMNTVLRCFKICVIIKKYFSKRVHTTADISKLSLDRNLPESLSKPVDVKERD